MITMSALAYSFWIVTFWYVVAMIILSIWLSLSEEMAGLLPGLIMIVLTIVYIIRTIIWLYIHWAQIGGGHIVNIVK